MATVSQSLKLNDGVSPVLDNMQQSMSKVLVAFAKMQQATNQNMDMAQMQVARENLNEVGVAIRMAQEEQARLNATMRQMKSPEVDAPVLNPSAMPRAPTIQDPSPQIPNLGVPTIQIPHISIPDVNVPPITLTVEGYEESKNKIVDMGTNLDKLVEKQGLLAKKAELMDFIPDNTQSEILKVENGLSNLKSSLERITEHHKKLNGVMSKSENDKALQGMQELERNLLSTVAQQERLNAAMESGDLRGLNQSAKELKSNIASLEKQTMALGKQYEKFNSNLLLPSTSIPSMPKMPSISMPKIPSISMPKMPSMQTTGYEAVLEKTKFINSGLEKIITTQDKVNRQAQALDLMPNATQSKIQKADTSIKALVKSLQSAQTRQEGLNSSMNKAESAKAIKSISMLETDILGALQAQDKLNKAMESGDLNQINSSAEMLVKNITSAEKQIAKLDKQYSTVGATSLTPVVNQPGPVTVPSIAMPEIPIPRLDLPPIKMDVQGYDEARNTILGVNGNMEKLVTTQDKINRQVQVMDFIPINTTDKIQRADEQIQELTKSLALTQRKQQALNSTMNKAESDRAIKSINILEKEILSAVQVQEKLNMAMESGDVSQINSSVEKLTRNIANAENQVAKLNKQYGDMGIDTVDPMINQPGTVTVPPVTVPPITIPEIDIPRLDMPPIEMDVQGYEEARNNVLRINTNMERLVTTQNAINKQALAMDFMPGSTQNKIKKADTSLRGLTKSLQIAQTRQQQLNTTMSKTEASKAVKSINKLESRILKAVKSQDRLNRAMATGDLKAANRAANELTRNIARADKETQKVNRSQQNHNTSLDAGNNKARGILSTLRNIAGAYAGLSTAKNMFSGALDQKHAEITFQARFGDEEVGTAMFNKLQKQAETSAFAFEDLAQNTLSFMSMTTNPKQLDGLNSLAEKLAMFDTTGQGLAGAGFSIKEAMSGDIVSLAERFNINKSAIKSFGLDELGKSGDIEGFVKQFDAMLEAMNMGDEAVAMLANSPKQRLDAFVSTFKTKFASAATAAIDALQPLMDKLFEFMTSDQFNVFIDNLSVGLTNLANGAIWAWNGLTQLWGVLTSVYAAIAPYSGIIWGVVAAFAAFQVISAIGSVAMGIYALATGISAASQLMHAGASFAAAAGQTSLNSALLACPITWIVIAVIGLVAALIYLCKTNDQVAATLMRAWNMVLNSIELICIGWIAAFYGVLNFMGSFKVGFLSILEGAINGAIGMINDFIGLLNNIPGVSIDVVGQVSFAAGAKASENVKKQSRADDIGSRLASYNENVARREQNVQDMLADRELKRQEKADKKSNRASKSTEVLDNYAGKQMGLENPDNFDIDNIDKVGSVGGIEDPVEMQDDDLKLLREIAEMTAIQNYVTLKPEIKVQTGDIRNDVDIDQVVKRIEETIEVEVAAHAKEVYNLG